MEPRALHPGVADRSRSFSGLHVRDAGTDYYVYFGTTLNSALALQRSVVAKDVDLANPDTSFSASPVVSPSKVVSVAGSDGTVCVSVPNAFDGKTIAQGCFDAEMNQSSFMPDLLGSKTLLFMKAEGPHFFGYAPDPGNTGLGVPVELRYSKLFPDGLLHDLGAVPQTSNFEGAGYFIPGIGYDLDDSALYVIGHGALLSLNAWSLSGLGSVL